MKQASTTLILSEGKTLTYVIPIVFCAIAAIISFVLFWPLGVILTLICISLVLVESGLEFKWESMEYRKIKSLFGITWGNWVKINEVDSFHLRLSVETVKYQRVTPGSSTSFYAGLPASSKSITYDFIYLTKSNSWVTVFEFSSYKLALQLVNYLRALETVEVIDHIALKLEENQQKRMNRMR